MWWLPDTMRGRNRVKDRILREGEGLVPFQYRLKGKSSCRSSTTRTFSSTWRWQGAPHPTRVTIIFASTTRLGDSEFIANGQRNDTEKRIIKIPKTGGNQRWAVSRRVGIDDVIDLPYLFHKYLSSVNSNTSALVGQWRCSSSTYSTHDYVYISTGIFRFI